jgi:hypothetical protein
MAKDRNLEWALFDLDNPESLASLLAGRGYNLGLGVMGSDGTSMRVLKVNEDGELVINLEASSITIGDVRIKDAVGSFYASVEDANTARTTGTKVLAVQHVDATGKVSPAGEVAGNAPFIQTDAQAADNAAAPTDTLQIGGRYDASPVERDDGDLAAISTGPFGKVETANQDRSTGTGLVTDLTSVSGVPFTPGAQTTLTAPGDGATENVLGYKNHVWAVTIANIDTSVDVAIHGALKDSGFGNIEASNPPVDTQFTSNGVFFLIARGSGFNFLKPVFAAEAGGANATVTFEYLGSN